jgi:hypothetical protein
MIATCQKTYEQIDFQRLSRMLNTGNFEEPIY